MNYAIVMQHENVDHVGKILEIVSSTFTTQDKKGVMAHYIGRPDIVMFLPDGSYELAGDEIFDFDYDEHHIVSEDELSNDEH